MLLLLHITAFSMQFESILLLIRSYETIPGSKGKEIFTFFVKEKKNGNFD